MVKRIIVSAVVLFMVFALVFFRCGHTDETHDEGGSGVFSDAAAGVDSDDFQAKDDTEEGWISLFNGKSMAGWLPEGAEAEGAFWMVRDGSLKGTAGMGSQPICLRYERVFSCYELLLEWKIGKRGRASVAYRTSNSAADAGCDSCLRYQLVDDLGLSGSLTSKECTGALNSFLPAGPKRVKVAGAWNTSRIVVKPDGVQHWLNNRKILEYPLNLSVLCPSADDDCCPQENVNLHKAGPVILTAQAGAVEFRKIKLREL